MNHPRIKALAYEDLGEELPVHTIVSFFKIKLQQHARGFLTLHFMDDLVQRKDPIQDESTLDESCLVGADYTVSNRVKF
jgi:hypothetical protein